MDAGKGFACFLHASGAHCYILTAFLKRNDLFRHQNVFRLTALKGQPVYQPGCGAADEMGLLIDNKQRISQKIPGDLKLVVI